MAFEIVQATTSDLDSCARILFEEFSKCDSGWTLPKAQEIIKDIFELHKDLSFCLKLDGKIIGILFCRSYSYIEGNYISLIEFAVSSEFQGKGFGLKALEFLESYAKEKGFNVLALQTHAKRQAINLYKKFGFKETGWVCLEKKI